jgi:hypothetical protein
MRKLGRPVLLWGLVLYAVAQLALTATLDRWQSSTAESVWHKKRKRLGELAAAEPDRPLLVMLGSSRTEGAFQAGRLNGLPGPGGKPLLAYNLGVPATGPLHELLYLRELLDAGIRPRVLLVEYLVPLLNEPQRGLTSEEGWIEVPRLSAAHLMRIWPYLTHPARVRRQWIESCTATWYVLRDDLHVHLRRKWSLEAPAVARPHDPWGETLLEAPPGENAEHRRQITHDLYYASLRGFRLGEGPTRALRDLLECCRRNQITVVLVLMPESTEFRRWYRPQGLADARLLLADLRQTFGVRVIDASDWVADQDFADGHHVYKHGARTFTTRLVEDLRPILAQAD